MKNKYLKFCDFIAKACGAFAVLALLLSILVIVELVFERYRFTSGRNIQSLALRGVPSRRHGQLPKRTHVSTETRFWFRRPNERKVRTRLRKVD